MVCASQTTRLWVLALAVVAAMVWLPYGALAETNEVVVAVTYYYIDDNGVISGSYYADEYHPLVVMLPAEVFFYNKVTFEDERSGNDRRRVVITIAIDEWEKEWRDKRYTGQYEWEGMPRGEKKYERNYGAEGHDRPFIATIWDLYTKVDGEWILEDWAGRTEGQHADVFTVDGPVAPGEPASMTLTDDLIFISTDQAMDPEVGD